MARKRAAKKSSVKKLPESSSSGVNSSEEVGGQHSTSKHLNRRSRGTKMHASQPMLAGWEPEEPASETSSKKSSETASETSAPQPVESFVHDDPSIPSDLSGQTVVLVDSHSLIYQLFHAVAPMSSPSGVPVAAVYGFLRDLADIRDQWQPAFLWCAFDLSEITFRNDLYEQYKAHREPMPDELRMQIPLIRKAVQMLGVGTAEAGGFEADDVLATLAKQVAERGGRALLITSDKDCRQLIGDQVEMYNIRKQQVFGKQELKETWGISPEQVVDFQALVGDSVDNVPGVPLIGPKLAQQLLEQFGSLDAVLENTDKVKGKKRAENLREYREQALLSRELVQLRDDVPLDIDWRTANFSQRDQAGLEELFEELGFKRLAERLLGEVASEEDSQEEWTTEYRLIETEAELKQLADQLRSAKLLAVDTETTSTNPRWAELVGISVAWEIGQAAYIPIRSPAEEPRLEVQAIQEHLGPIFSDSQIPKIGQNLKYDLTVFRAAGIDLRGVRFDTMVADYLVDPGQRDHSLDGIAARYLNHTTTKIKELIGSGRSQLTMDQVPLAAITDYACQDVDIPWRLHEQLKGLLEKKCVKQLFDEVEIPLVSVLAEMEYNGIRVDPLRLEELSGEFEERIGELRQEIFQLAGTEFNLDSPKQLSHVLYDQLGLPVLKKTQTGNSTDAEVLSQLAQQHELPSRLLTYRQLAKLKGTYVDALPQLICEKTGRIHTSFRQDVAATGRLSSTEPNLQNIPIRTEEGRQIRSAFRPGQDDWLLLAADYSQIELRVLAHYCGDANLQEAFQQDRDIHALVASEVYDVPLDNVTSEQRRNAKAINFGIIYGQSPYGLAKSLQISNAEAAEFIEAYFARLPGVRMFIEQTIQTCRAQGYVSTLLGRRRQVSGVRNFSELSESRKHTLVEPERIAVNTVIQGSAADLIKLAMLRVHQKLQKSKLNCRLLLQIHDELVFEVAEADCQELSEFVRNEMASVVNLDVPLRVDVKAGENWAACEPI